MASVTRLMRLARIATLPETRRAVLAAARSPALRDIVRRASTDRTALLRDLRSPNHARGLLRDAVRHPATRELADASLVFLPIRFMPAGWVATRVGRRLLRRYMDPPTELIDPTAFGASRPLKKVTGPASPDPDPAWPAPEERPTT